MNDDQTHYRVQVEILDEFHGWDLDGTGVAESTYWQDYNRKKYDTPTDAEVDVAEASKLYRNVRVKQYREGVFATYRDGVKNV